MKKRLLQLIFCLAAVLMLSGCLFKSVDELYALPEFPEDYHQLQLKLDEVMEELDAEYAAPLSGSNTATVQLQDMDGDGFSESTVAFFRVNSAQSPLRIMIFRQRTDGVYEVCQSMEGDGTAIDSISYVDLDGDGMKDILVSWQISASVHTVTAYKLTANEAVELVHTAYGKAFTVQDLDRDNQRELLVVQMDSAQEHEDRVEYFDLDGDRMVLAATAPISKGAQNLAANGACTGYLRDNIPALYLNVSCGDIVLTDIYAVRDGQFTNITLNPETGISSETIRYSADVSTQDINKDGIVEIPKPVQTREYPGQNTAGFWLTYWRQFDLEGNAYTVQINYHNLADGWYLNIPENWAGRITMRRDDVRSAWGERAVIFALWSGDPQEEPQDFLRIYRLSGSNRAARAQIGNRFVLKESENVLYAAEFYEIDWNCGMNEDNLIEYFTIIQKEWSNQ